MKKGVSKNNKISLRPETLENYLSRKQKTKRQKTIADERFSRLILGYEIYLARKKKKLTQQKLAQRLQTTQSEIARIETGDQNVTTDKLMQIAKALNKNLEIKFT